MLRRCERGSRPVMSSEHHECNECTSVWIPISIGYERMSQLSRSASLLHVRICVATQQ